MTDGSVAMARVATRTSRITVSGLIAALLCASAWIAIPAGSVPITLQVFVVLLAALLLPPAWSGAAVAVYLVLGALGAPVFSAGQGGYGVIVGPTGGYLIGFALGASGGSWARRGLNWLPVWVADAAAVVISLAVIYSFGTAWLATVANLTAVQAMAAGVLPFVALDAAKGAAAVAVATAVRKARGEDESL